MKGSMLRRMRRCWQRLPSRRCTRPAASISRDRGDSRARKRAGVVSPRVPLADRRSMTSFSALRSVNLVTVFNRKQRGPALTAWRPMIAFDSAPLPRLHALADGDRVDHRDAVGRPVAGTATARFAIRMSARRICC